MFRKGTRVRWQWGAHSATGRIAERFTKKVRRTLKGSEVTRDASSKEPAYLIVQEDGSEVLKSRSEIERA